MCRFGIRLVIRLHWFVTVGSVFRSRRQRHKHVFQRGWNLVRLSIHVVNLQMPKHLLRRQVVVHERMDRLAEQSRIAHPVKLSQLGQTLRCYRVLGSRPDGCAEQENEDQ